MILYSYNKRFLLQVQFPFKDLQVYFNFSGILAIHENLSFNPKQKFSRLQYLYILATNISVYFSIFPVATFVPNNISVDYEFRTRVL